MLAKKHIILLCVFLVIFSGLFVAPPSFSQDEATEEKIIERYKLMLIQKPKEGSTFDRLYQFYLEGTGLEAMESDYQLEATAKPNDPNIQLILGHIYKRLGKDNEALTAYQRAVELSQDDYYVHFALGQMYVILRQHEDAISELTKATSLSEQTQIISPEELTDIYKTLGHAYFRRDMLDEAIKSWEKISELDPDDIFARIELADLFREQELYPQAIAQYEAIINLKKDDTYRKCLSMREIGKIHEESGEYQKALTQYDAALGLTAQGNWLRKDLQHRIIAIYSADANWKDLIAYYGGKLEANPNDPEMLGLLAAAYIENQQLEEGIDTYKKGLTLSPTDIGLRLNLIGALRDAEKFEDAAAEYEALNEQRPDDIGIYRELGKLYLQLENEEKAKEVYQRLIKRDPESANIYITLAEIYAGHEWLEDAVAAYQKAIKLDPDNLDYIEYFGEFYYRQGESKKAIETWDLMVTDTKSTAENYDRLARLFETKKFSDEAIASSLKAVELMPETYRFRESLAKRLMNNEQYDEALLEYTEAMKLAPNAFFAEQMDDKRIELYKRQGTLVKRIEEIEAELDKSEIADNDKFTKQKRLVKMYLKLGNTTYALEILLEAIKLQPDDINVSRWTADIYVKEGRRDEAITIYRHLTTIDNTNAREYYSNIANLYLETLEFEEALAAAKQIVAHSPRNPEGHQLLAKIAMRSGDYDASVDSFKQAIRLRPEAIDIRIELAQLYHNSGDFRLAIAQYWRCWNLSDNISDKLNLITPLGTAYNSLGRRVELTERLKQMTKSNTSGIAPVLALAQVHRDEGDLSSARFQLARALDQQRENPELLYQLVGISLDLGDIDESLNYQQRLVKADPAPIHQQKLGELLFDVGREQEAVQTWSKVLHQKKHTLDAEIRLAKLLIRHGLMEEAFFALDNAAEKITGSDTYIGLYQIGATLVGISEPEKALPYFQRIIEMSKPAPEQGLTTSTKKAKTTNPNFFYGPPRININKLSLASLLENRVNPRQYSVRNVSAWVPTTFEEAQAASLVQMKTILDDLGKLDGMLTQFEESVTANPKDIQTLELLAQLYILMNNQEKTGEVLDKLLAASPANLVYQGIKLRNMVTREQTSYESFIDQLNKMTGLSEVGTNWYQVEYASYFVNRSTPDDVEKLLDKLEGVNVMSLSNSHRLIDLFVQRDRAETAERMLSELQSSAAGHLSHQYTRIYESVTNTYLSNGDTDKAIEYFWKYVEKTNPTISHGRHAVNLIYSSYSSGQSQQINFPSPTAYYSQARLDFLQKFFNKIWIKEQQEIFFTALEEKYNGAEGRNRIYPALAMSYCKWWDGKRDKALEVLHNLQTEFPNDLTLKMNTIFVSIQSGKHNVALDVLKEIIHLDPKNLNQYYELTLKLATYTGDSSAVRELMKNILNSPISVQQLHSFSQKLQGAGFTQYAVAVSQKATELAMRERDPNFLRNFSNHLNDLGRGQDAARLAQRAVKLENLKVLSGQTLPNMNTQGVTLTPKRLKMIQERETKLVKIVEQNPKSFKAQSNLAAFYASRNRVPKAIETYQAALELRPNDSTLRNQFAEMLRRVGESKKAIEQYTYLLKNSISASQFSYYHYQSIIETFIQAGEINKLISIAKGMIENNQDSGRSNEFVRRIAQHFRNNNNNIKPLIEIYEKSVESGSETYFYDLVSAYISTGNREKARQLLVGKLKTDPTEREIDVIRQVNVVLRLSELNEGLDNLKNLTKDYEEKFSIDTADISMLYLLAILKIVTNDLEGSDAYVDKLLHDDPTNISPYWLSTIARTYQQKSDTNRQLRVLEASIENVDLQNAGQLSSTYGMLGTIYADKGEKEKAQKAIRKMGNLRLMRSGGTRYYDKESVARTYMEHGLYDEAEELLIEVINDFSAQSYYRERAQEQLATIRVKRGDTDAELKNTMEDMNLVLLRTKAEEHKRRRSYYEAIKVYEQIIKKAPDDLASRAALALLYTEQNQHDEAIEMWEALLKIDPANTKYQDGLVNVYKVTGRFDEAIKFAKGYIQENPDIGLHHNRLAGLYASNGQIDTAITTYKKAIELYPSDAKSHEELANLYEKKRDYDAAEKSYDDALKFSAPGSSQGKLRLDLMRIYQHQGKLEEMLKQAEEQGTLTLDMQQERAQIYQKSGDLKKAASAYQKALGMTTNSHARGNIQRQLISIYSKLGKLEEFLKETEEQGSVSFEMQKEIARLHENKREYEKAADAYKKALQMTTQSFERRELERQMMQLYRRSGKFEQFLTDMEKDGTLSADLQVELGKYYSLRGQSEKAIAAFQKANNMNDSSDREEISALMMHEFLKLNKTDKAIEIYESLLSAATESRTTSYYSGSSGFRIQTGKEQARESLINVFKRNRKLTQLEKVYTTKLENKPNDKDILIVLAEIHWNSNKYAKAAEVYQTLFKVEPDNVKNYFYAAASLKKNGQEEQAQALIEQGNNVLSSRPDNKDSMLLCTLGSICYESKMYAPAITLFNEAAKVNELTGINSNIRWQQENIYGMLGKGYMETKQYEKAVEAFQHKMKLATSDYVRERIEKEIQRAYDEGNLHEKHIPKQLEKVKQNPNDVNARITLAESYVSSEKYDEAIVQYEKLSELQPNSPKWHKTVGDLYGKSKNAERLQKAAAAYEKAIALDPNSYEFYDTLAKLYSESGDSKKADDVYLRVLNASQNPKEQDRIVKAVIELHDPKTYVEKLKILEDLQAKATHSILLHRLLGDVYLGDGDTEKAQISYKKWLEKTNNQDEKNHGKELHQLAERLMDKNILPEIALEAAKQATEISSDSINFTTLGNAYLVNEQYEEAFKEFERSFNLMDQSGNFRGSQVEPLLRRISHASKNIKDTTQYQELMGKLVDSIPSDAETELDTKLLLAEFCRELNMTDKAKVFVQKTGFFPETAWLTLGPFDNTKGVGYSTTFIPEEQTQIDKTAEYDGVSGKITWGKSSDETFDGFFDFGKDEQFYAAYAWISFTSPEDREAEIRFDSDDQGKVYLNGKKVYAHRRTRGASIDRRTIPVTLIDGENSILVKVCNESLPWGFYLRITDTDGKPFDDLKVVNPE